MAKKKIETIVAQKIYPYTLNQKEQAELSQIIRMQVYEYVYKWDGVGA